MNKLTDVKPRLKTVTTETRTRSRKPLRSMNSIREEVYFLFLKKYFLYTCTLLTLKKPAYVCRLSKGRACMYASRPTTSRVHLCNFSKIKLTVKDDKAVSIGMADQNPLKTQDLTENSKMIIKPIKVPKNYPLKTLEASPVWSPILL
jgi:hypothetical protein